MLFHTIAHRPVFKKKYLNIMTEQDNTDNLQPRDFGDDSDGSSLSSLFASGKWQGYFAELAETLDIEISAYDQYGSGIFSVHENPVCKFTRGLQSGTIDCPGSCARFDYQRGPELFTCQAGQRCFILPVDGKGGRIFIAGRGGFGEYRGLLDFLRVLRHDNYPVMPVSEPFRFISESEMKSCMQYLSLTLERHLKSHNDTERMTDQLLRIPSFFDSQAFGTLSRQPELMYRYIIDTMGFVFDELDAVILTKSDDGNLYRALYSTGRYRESLENITLNAESSYVKNMLEAGSIIFSESIRELLPEDSELHEGSAHFMPLITSNGIDAVVAIFNKPFARNDIKILNAFREFIQLSLENRKLQSEVMQKAGVDRKLAYLNEVTRSVIPILDQERLMHALLEKSLQLLSAEQGSLMMLDSETSELVVQAGRSMDDTVKAKMRFSSDEGIAGKVLGEGGPFLVEDIEKDPRFRQLNRPRYRTKSFISVPIRISDRLSGVLNVSDKTKGNVFSKEDLVMLESFITSVAVAIERSMLHDQSEKLQKLSITDPLTGIYNRRYLNRRLAEEITRYNRYKHPFSFLMLDLDKFKDYNDTFGHIAGDNLIRNLASIMEKSLRTIDIAARFGGDEFVTIFPQTPKVDAIQISNRLKDEIQSGLREHNMEMALTISVGLATYPDDASSIMELIEKTDQALYLAKKGGGNRVVYL